MDDPDPGRTVDWKSWRFGFPAIRKWSAKSKPAKDFTLKDLSSKKVSLSDFRGKVVLLNFFATWCPPCRLEIPELVKISQQKKKGDLVVLGVSLDKDVVPFMLKNFVKEMKISYPVLMGTEEVADQLSNHRGSGYRRYNQRWKGP